MKTEPFTLCFFDVGQGDSIGGILPANKITFLIDVANAEVISSFFKLKNINTFDFIIITHNDLDHYKGLFNLIENHDFRTQKIYLNYDRGPDSPKNDSYKQLLRRIHIWENDGKLKASPIHTDTRIPTDPLKISVLHPSYAFLGKMITYNKWNDASVVLRLSYQGMVIILTGDIEDVGIDELTGNNSELKCNVLKIPHHGSYPPNDALDKLIGKAEPQYAIISVGTNNSFKHPNNKTIALLKAKDIKILCTEVTSQCCSKITDAGKPIIKILSHESKYDDFFLNNNACPCAGNIFIEIKEDGLSIIPDDRVLAKIKGHLELRLC